MNALYDIHAERGPDRVLTTSVLERISVTLPDVQIDRLTTELAQERLITADRRAYEEPYDTEVQISASGRREVERWIATDRPTEHLDVAPSTVLHIHGDVSGSQLFVGSSDISASMQSAGGSQLDQLSQKARELLRQLPNLSAPVREEVEADISILDEQAHASAPDASRFKPAVRRLLAWASGAATTGAGIALQTDVQQVATDVLRMLT